MISREILTKGWFPLLRNFYVRTQVKKNATVEINHKGEHFPSPIKKNGGINIDI